MATSEERVALLGVGCPWCSAPPGEPCSIPALAPRAMDGGRHGRNVPAPMTLDAGCHDARWRAALDRSAPVRAEVLQERREAVEPVRPRVLVSAGERPW